MVRRDGLTDHVLYSCEDESAQISALSRNVSKTNLIDQFVLLLSSEVVFHILILYRWFHSGKADYSSGVDDAL